jgi:hypothetical protein
MRRSVILLPPWRILLALLPRSARTRRQGAVHQGRAARSHRGRGQRRGGAAERAGPADARDRGAIAHAQNVALPPETVLRQQVLDRLVLEEIQQQHADRAGIKVTDEQVNAALEDIAKRQNLTLEQLPREAGGRRHRLPPVPRRAQARDRAPDPAPARRHAAHRRHAARARSVPRTPEEDRLGRQRIQRRAYPDRRGAGREAGAARAVQRSWRTTSTSARAMARTSVRSRSPIRRARARWRAARWAGARAPSCRPSWRTWSRA